MLLLNTSKITNELAKHKNNANDIAKHKNNANEATKQENDGKSGL